ncbi:hypothetical protein [Candidatus Poriferisodalis sp.]|uniref:hypothetical protein n=1 Tax=Candidatus Poriferisodalis sp. TaxID=3101277 RepID=UPI003B012C2E
MANGAAGTLGAVLKRLDLRGRDGRLADLLLRPRAGDLASHDAVRQLIDEVRNGGDAAVRKLTAHFDLWVGGDTTAGKPS